MNILFYGTKKYDEEFFDAILPEYPELSIHYLEANLSPETAALASGYEAICAFVNANIGAETVEQLHRQGVKLILMRCAGYNNVDLKKTAEYGIKVARVPGYSPEAVAEHAMALALTANRHTHKAYIKCRENDFSLNGLMGVDLYKKTAGIIGTGKIGMAMARICRGFGMRVLGYDMYPNPNNDIEYVALDELLAQSDLISLHCPLTEQTHHLINRESIAKMKDGVILINCARGELVDIDALVEGIESEKIGALGLDTVEGEEGIIHEDHRIDILKNRNWFYLHQFRNVIFTPHMAFYTDTAVRSMVDCGIRGIVQMKEGTPCRNEL